MKITDVPANSIVKLDGLFATMRGTVIPVVGDNDHETIIYYGMFIGVDVPPDHEFEVVGQAKDVPAPDAPMPKPRRQFFKSWLSR